MTKQFKQNTAVLEAKCNLYRQLLRLDPDTMSDEDVDLMYQLSKDSQVQNLLQVKSVLDKM